MQVEARITAIWSKQKLLLASLLTGFTAWFIFDGAVAWPKSNERWAVWAPIRKAATDENTAKDEYAKVATQRGWKTEPPEKEYTPEKLREQFLASGACFIGGLAIFGYWLSQRRRVLRMDADGIVTPGGVRVPFEAVTGIGKKKWDSKGIAKVRYELAGKAGEFIVDDYKFDTKPARAILEEIEKHLLARTQPQPQP